MSWKVKAFTISVCNKNKFYFTISEPNNYYFERTYGKNNYSLAGKNVL